MKRRTRKTEQARAILERLGILPSTDRDRLYWQLDARGYVWNTMESRWEA